MARVKTHFDLPVVLDGGIGYFDGEQDIWRGGEGGGVKILAEANQSEIRLRLGKVVQMDRELSTDDRLTGCETLLEYIVKARHMGGMRRPDR